MTSVTLDDIRADAHHAYPVDVLAGCDTGLVLFAAAWLGKQDAIFYADAGVRATCVDIDGDKLERMREVYPEAWEFVERDAYAYARAWRSAGRRWDVVSIDSHSGAFDRVASEVDLWCDVARDAVVLGSGAGQVIVAPEGWRVSRTIERSGFRGGVFWTVLERAWR